MAAAAAAVMLVKVEQDASSSAAAAASRNTRIRKMRSVRCPEKQRQASSVIGGEEGSKSGLQEQALSLCKCAAEYYPLLRQCRALWDAKRVHAHMVASGHDGGTYAGNLVVQMYGRCGSVDDALAAFECIKERNEFSWNLVIGACCNNGQARQALQLFRRMDCEGGVGPNKVTFMSIVAACSSLGAVAEGRAIHARICATGNLRNDIALGNALITMYGKWGSLADARAVFDGLVAAKDVITWTAMITAYAQHGHAKDALQLFRQMGSSVKLDKTAFVSVVGACANLGADALAEGRALHAHIVDYTGLESDVLVANSLVNMYGKCGSVADAKSVFDGMQQLRRNVVSWNSLILVYAQSGHCEQALDLYRRMNVKKNEVTFVNVLGACSSLAEGKLVHQDILGSGLESDALVGTAVIRMYGNCGGVDDARAAFNKITSKTMVAWNALLAAYAHRAAGRGDEAILLFHGMYLEGVKPNGVTFITLLDACSHAGCLERGLCYFVDLRDNGISASAEHYGCMVDILGRAGQVDKAEELILSMPFQPDAIAWMSLLGACKMHGDVERALRAAQQLVHMEPHHGAPYMLLLSSTG